jgi:alcohol dehydrogenase class IV
MQGTIEFLPTVQRIRHGDGVLAEALREEIAASGAARPFAVLTRALAGTPVEAALREAAPGCVVHSASFEHVTPGAVLDAARAAAAAGADLVIALGGGSALDTAKGLRFALAAGLDEPAALLPAMDAPSPAGQWLAQISVPTTLSGAEYTRSFSATDRARGDKRSHTATPLASRAIAYDPRATLATPDSLWLGSGFVALDHALEVFVASGAHPVADTLKREAARTLIERLPCSRESAAHEDRLACQLAAWMADHSPLRTRAPGGGVPWSHLLAYDLAAIAGVSYAATASLTLANSLRVLAETQAGAARTRELETALGLDVPLADFVEGFAARLGLPTTPGAAGLDEATLERVAEAAGRRGKVDVPTCRRVLGG